MKKYYSTLSREKKKEVKQIFQKEYKNTDLYTRLVRLYIYAGIGFISSIIIFGEAFVYDEKRVESLLIAIPLFIASFIFLIGSIIIKRNTLNKIALKNK